MSVSTTSSSNYYETATAAVTGPPFTWSCWFYPTVAAARTIMNVHQGGVTNEYFYLASESSRMNFEVRNAASGNSALLTGAAPNFNAWNHGFAVSIATNNRRASLNGGTVVSTASNRPTIGIDTTTLLSGNGVAKAELDGRLADVAIWDVALSDDEGARLALGVDPLFIQPENLIHYWRCIRNGATLPDYIGTLDIAEVGTVTQSEHVPLASGHPFLRPTFPFAGGAAAPAGVLMPIMSTEGVHSVIFGGWVN